MKGRRRVRAAVVLWIVLAIVVWNVTFDRVVVEAGRAYIRAARAAADGGSYLRVDDWMSAAIVRGLWAASAFALVILAVGLLAIRMASRRDRAVQRSVDGQALSCHSSLVR